MLTHQPAPEVQEALRGVIRRQAECCPFLDLVPKEHELTLRVSGPTGAEAILDLIYQASAP